MSAEAPEATFPIIVLAGRQSYESVGLAAQVSEVHLDDIGQFMRRKLIGTIPLNAPFLADFLMTLEAANNAVFDQIQTYGTATIFMICPRRNSNGLHTVQQGIYDRRSYDPAGLLTTLRHFFIPRPLTLRRW